MVLSHFQRDLYFEKQGEGERSFIYVVWGVKRVKRGVYFFFLTCQVDKFLFYTGTYIIRPCLFETSTGIVPGLFFLSFF